MSDIKNFKILFFGNINTKIFNSHLEDLANKNEIIIEKSSTNAIKNIILNKNKNKKKYDIEYVLNFLKQEGKIKNISGSEKFKQFKEFDFIIYNFKGFDNLNFVFKYKENKLNLIVDSMYLYKIVSLMKEIEKWNEIENILLNKISIYI